METELFRLAWECRDRAYLYGATSVGAAALSNKGNIFMGCNVEHPFRSHDIHAEVNAIGNMVSQGHSKLQGLAIVADRERFTPCGSCMDWVFEFGGPSCVILLQGKRNGTVTQFWAEQLMPYYPK